MLALILPISPTHDMSGKAPQRAEVQRAICKAALLWFIKTAQQRPHAPSSLGSMRLEWESNEYLMMTFFLPCVLLRGSPQLTKGTCTKKLVFQLYYLKVETYVSLKNVLLSGGVQAMHKPQYSLSRVLTSIHNNGFMRKAHGNIISYSKGAPFLRRGPRMEKTPLSQAAWGKGSSGSQLGIWAQGPG